MEGVKVIPAYMSLCKVLWRKEPRVIMVTDNQPLLGWIRTGWVKTDPLCQGALDFIISRITELKLEVLWIETKSQRADRQTKFIYFRV